MDVQAFWDVIGNYNQSTWIGQCVILAFIAFSFVVALWKKTTWLLSLSLGVGTLFIGVVFFLLFGTQPIQKFFAAPLYLAIGILFLYEAAAHKSVRFHKPTLVQWGLLTLFIVYPLVSFSLGHSYPQLVVHIMPCPLISLCIVSYSCYEKKNNLLLLLMTIWGLTGVKAFFANALEDVILLLCGLFGLSVLVKEFLARKKPI